MSHGERAVGMSQYGEPLVLCVRLSIPIMSGLMTLSQTADDGRKDRTLNVVNEDPH